MTEREYYRERAEDGVTRREVYSESAAPAGPTADPAADVSRDVSRARIYDAPGERVVERERAHIPSESARRSATARRIQQVISFIVGLIVALLAIRFVLLLLGAAQAPFVQLIYGLTQPFTAPFQGIFGEPVVGASVVEWASLVAIAIYSLLGYALNRLVDIAYKPARSPDSWSS